MPLSCHLMLTAGPRATLGLLSPSDRVDRARRPVHDRVRGLGRADLPGRLRRRRRVGAARRRSATTSTGSWRPTSRRSPSGTRPCAWARRAARSRPSSTATSATRSSGSSSTPGTCSTSTSGWHSPVAPGLDDRAAVGLGDAGRRHPGHGHALLHARTSRTVSRSRTRRSASELAARDPALWRRIQARRAFMRDALGIELHEDVLPLSNIPAWLPPFLLDTSRAMTMRPAPPEVSGARPSPSPSASRVACRG